ncbi:MAG: HAD family hydrolase [Spirochaetaceae bacterium]
MANKYTIIWDWNGTLLNDVDSSVLCMNKMLYKRNMPQLTRSRYRDIFTFPVKNFYKSLGFNFSTEPFPELASEFITLFKDEVKNMELFPEVYEQLEFFKKKGYNQIILSAMEHTALLIQVESKKISSYFSEIIGLNNILASSKTQNAVKYLKDNSISPSNCILIGDTYHDYEVAKEIGCKTVLVNSGNQDLQKIIFEDSVEVIENLKEITNYGY